MSPVSKAPYEAGSAKARRSRGCVLFFLATGAVWAIATTVHGYVMWPHIPMDISAEDPATRAAFDAVVRRHVLVHLAVGAAPLVAALVLLPRICRKRN